MSLVKSLTYSGWARVCAAAFCLSLPGIATRGDTAHAAETLEARKLPMTFKWHAAMPGACQSDCTDWISAVGIITGDTPAQFDDFTRGRDLKDTRVVLDSSGGSVLDAIKMGRSWRSLGVRTSVGMVIERDGTGRAVMPEAYCESMCVFLLLGGVTRDIPPEAHIRVHQIWMGDRANDPKAAKYSADDMTIVERDIGRLAKYTFEMGGSGDLLSLALSVPPWEPLHELTSAELRLSNLLSGDAMADNTAAKTGAAPTLAEALPSKTVRDRFAGKDTGNDDAPVTAIKPTKTAEALPPTGGTALAAPER